MVIIASSYSFVNDLCHFMLFVRLLTRSMQILHKRSSTALRSCHSELAIVVNR